MHHRISSVSLLTLAFTALSMAGGPKVTEGSLEPLRNEQLFNVQAVWEDNFEYDGDPFSEFYAKEIKKLSKDAKELESFKADWIRWKDTTYAAAFANGIENFFEDEDDVAIKGIKGTTHSTTPKYTILLNTIEINSGGMSTAYIELQLTIVETKNHKNVIAKIEGLEIVGRIPYASEEVRVKDAYYLAGDEFAEEVLFDILYDK